MTKNYAITMFNLLDVNTIKKRFKDCEGQLKYMLGGIEVCPETNKTHIQGFIQTTNRKKGGSAMKLIKKIFKDDTIHVEQIRGTIDENIAYCKKDGKWFECGELVQQGERNDLKRIMGMIDEGLTDIQIIRKCPEIYNKYIKFILNYRILKKEEDGQNYLKEKMDGIRLNNHQKAIVDILEKQDDRSILWITDKKGGHGKTTLADWLECNKKAFVCANNKTADIAYAYDGEEYFVMDLTRSMNGFINYNVIESIKNGRIFSTKYKPCVKRFKNPKVLILSNFSFDREKLSKDRWDEYTIYDKDSAVRNNKVINYNESKKRLMKKLDAKKRISEKSLKTMKNRLKKTKYAKKRISEKSLKTNKKHKGIGSVILDSPKKIEKVPVYRNDTKNIKGLFKIHVNDWRKKRTSEKGLVLDKRKWKVEIPEWSDAENEDEDEKAHK